MRQTPLLGFLSLLTILSATANADAQTIRTSVRRDFRQPVYVEPVGFPHRRSAYQDYRFRRSYGSSRFTRRPAVIVIPPRRGPVRRYDDVYYAPYDDVYYSPHRRRTRVRSRGAQINIEF